MYTRLLKVSKSKPRLIKKPSIFKIQLFDQVLDFNLPRPDGDNEPGLLGYSDQRPFVNTASKQKYICEDDLGHYYLPFYICYWLLPKSGFFSKPKLKLNFELIGHAKTKNQEQQYPDLSNFEMLNEWVQQHYRDVKDSFSGIYLKKHDHGYIEIVDDKNDDQVPVASEVFHSERVSINDKTLLKVSPLKSRIDYWLPFSDSDALCFSFSLTALSGQVDAEEATVRANIIIETVINSVNLESLKS